LRYTTLYFRIEPDDLSGVPTVNPIGVSENMERTIDKSHVHIYRYLNR
jgi:hypothetical protein